MADFPIKQREIDDAAHAARAEGGKEAEARAGIAALLEGLDEAAQCRVVEWMRSRYGADADETRINRIFRALQEKYKIGEIPRFTLMALEAGASVNLMLASRTVQIRIDKNYEIHEEDAW